MTNVKVTRETTGGQIGEWIQLSYEYELESRLRKSSRKKKISINRTENKNVKTRRYAG